MMQENSFTDIVERILKSSQGDKGSHYYDKSSSDSDDIKSDFDSDNSEYRKEIRRMEFSEGIKPRIVEGHIQKWNLSNSTQTDLSQSSQIIVKGKAARLITSDNDHMDYERSRHPKPLKDQENDEEMEEIPEEQDEFKVKALIMQLEEVETLFEWELWSNKLVNPVVLSWRHRYWSECVHHNYSGA